MHKIDFLKVLLHADLLSKIVFGVLILLSFYVVMSILMNYIRLKFQFITSRSFIKEVYSKNLNLSDLKVLTERYDCNKSHLASIAIQHIKDIHLSPSKMPDHIRLIMINRMNYMIDEWHQKIKNLSLISYISPFIGLFGTVWGIIIAFQSIGANSNDMSLVFIGMSEALLATLMGLVVAIPSYIGHHYFYNKIMKMEVDIELFIDSFISQYSHINFKFDNMN